MTMQYFLVIMKCDTSKLDCGTGRALVEEIKELRIFKNHSIKTTLYQVTDESAMLKFEGELERNKK
jgi:hypothetical protein